MRKKGIIVLNLRRRKAKGIKKTIKIFSFIIGGVFLLLVLLFFILKIGRIQQFIAHSVTQSLSERVDAEIRIGKIDYKPFNTVSLYDLYIEDQQKDTLLYVKELNARFKFFQAFKGKFLFHSVDLIEFAGNMLIDKDGSRNFDFLIDAFSSNEKKKNTDVDFAIEHLNIQKSALRIRRSGKKRDKKDQMPFNPNDIFFSDINSDFVLKTLDKDSLKLEILHLSLQEKSGLKIKGLKSEISGSLSELSAPSLTIKLEQSQLNLQDIKLKYDSIADFKNFVEKVSLNAQINNSQINLNDISPFVANFKGIDITAQVGANISGTISNLHAKSLSIKQGDLLSFKIDIDLNGLPNIEQTFLFSDIKELKIDPKNYGDFISKITGKPVRIFDELTRLGNIIYKGNITGLFSDLVLFGKLKTDVGDISTDILLKFEKQFSALNYNGTIKSERLKIGQLLQKDNLGDFSFYLNTNGKKKENSPFQGTVNAKVSSGSFNNYSYCDLEFEGKYDGSGYNGKLIIDDENIQAQFNGLIDLSNTKPKFNFELIAKNINPNALNLIEKYPEGLVSFRGVTSMTGKSLDDLNGYIQFDSISIRNKKEELEIDKLLFVSHTEEHYTSFSVKSKYINGSILGDFKYSSLPSIASSFLKKYLPAFEKKQKKDQLMHFNIDLKIDETGELFKILDLPYFISGLSTIKGSVDERKNFIDIKTEIPEFKFRDKKLKDSQLHLLGNSKTFETTLNSKLLTNEDSWSFTLLLDAENNKLNSHLKWYNQHEEIINKGVFSSLTEFFTDKKKKLKVTTKIAPTELTLDNSIWNIQASSIDFTPGQSIHFNNLHIGNEERFLGINGVGSKEMKDSVNLELKDIDLSIISLFVNTESFQTKGKTSGKAVIYSLLKRPILASNLSVKNLSFNDKLIGDATVSSAWKQDEQKLFATAEINTEKYHVAKAQCTYTPQSNQLDVFVDAEKFNISFLTSYFQEVIPHLSGYASGLMYIGGPMTDIRFDGRMMVSEGELSVGLMGTTYYFNDTIVIEPTRIEIPNASLYDKNKNKATVTGYANHNGGFKNFLYNVSINAKNAEVMSLAPGVNDFFSGQGYADATVRIYGDESVINFKINGVSKPGTKVLLQFAKAGKVTDDEFIQYIVPEEEELAILERKKEKKKKINVKLDVQIEATTDAEIEFLIDPSGGDMISGTGRGNIRLYYDDSQSDVKMYGNYIIEKGNYLFTLQDVIRKGFKIDKGSSIRWSGDPLKAQVDIKAIYNVTASLKDLMDETLLQSTNRSSVPVDCLLQLNGDLMSPTVKFDIQLPSSDEGIKQIVRNIINTDEMMMRQVVYLLLFSRFYTPIYLRDANNLNTGTQEFFSLASTTLSSHLNHIMAQFSNMFTLGVDVRRMDEENMEYQAAILFQPNERWIVNGNFGVRDNKKMLENYNRFITDIDIEYLLTKSGKLRLKAYNHTIDRAQLRTAKNTQGVGFMYKEDFNSFGELFSYYWSKLKGFVTKEKKDETKN